MITSQGESIQTALSFVIAEHTLKAMDINQLQPFHSGHRMRARKRKLSRVSIGHRAVVSDLEVMTV